jgi:hypothetical protein
VFALLLPLIAVCLGLIALGPLFIFLYTLIRAAGARELNPEFNYADNYAAEDYPTTGSRPTDSEYLLDIAL